VLETHLEDLESVNVENTNHNVARVVNEAQDLIDTLYDVIEQTRVNGLSEGVTGVSSASSVLRHCVDRSTASSTSRNSSANALISCRYRVHLLNERSESICGVAYLVQMAAVTDCASVWNKYANMSTTPGSAICASSLAF
jgi:hypothetical protein